MREFTVPPLYAVPDDGNVTDDVFRHAEETPDRPVVSRQVEGAWQLVSAAQFASEIRSLAAGLIASGIAAGDRVAVMSRTRYEWTLAELAIVTAGAVLVPIYETSSAEQVRWILGDSGAKAVVVEHDGHAALVERVSPDLPAPPVVWGIDAGDLTRLVETGLGLTAEQVEQRRRSRAVDDLVMIIYTSGTTGRPKGCMLTHRNSLSYLGNLMPAGMDRVFDPAHSTLLFLPLAHSFAQAIQTGALAQGVLLGHSPDMRDLQADLLSFRPHLVLSVPRVFEKVYNAAKHTAHAQRKGAVFDRADTVAVRYSEALERGRPGLALRLQHGLFDRLVYGKVRAAMGGQVAYVISGGAPLGARLGHFFRGAGIDILEGYGLTETTAGGAVNLPRRQRMGSVGPPIPGCSIRIADDGEILMKGDVVFRGYWNNPDATRETFTEDGWFKTGDIGTLDDDGFLFVTGRKKELIVTAAGKNVAPAVLEDRVRRHWLVSQCLVVGDQRPYVAALVTLDADALGPWLAETGRDPGIRPADLCEDPRLLAELQTAIDDANEAVSAAEAIKRFRVLPADLTEAGGELTPTLKLRRDVVLKEYAGEVEALYR